MLRWRATCDSHTCEWCLGLDGRFDGDGWDSSLPPNGDAFDEPLISSSGAALVGPPPLHYGCRCWVEDDGSSTSSGEMPVSSSGVL
jgi:hypothetical protein